MSLYVSEFLFRGHEPAGGAAPAWHLVLGQSGSDAFGAPLPDGPVMTMQQAEAAGYDLPAVIAAINTAALAEAERLGALLAAYEAETEA